jgi:uncharacterized protein YndB with AHSA1/START domain
VLVFKEHCMASIPRADGVCETSRLLPFKAADVVAAFAHPELLAQWWGPDGFSNDFEVFEFRPEGRWTFVMIGPDGQRYANENVFLATGPDQVVIQHVCAPLFTLTVTMTEVDMHTHVLWHQAFDDPAVAAAIGHIIEPANEQNLDRLNAVLVRQAARAGGANDGGGF